PTLFFAVPTIYVRLVNDLTARAGVDLSHMRLFCSGSAPLAAETHVAFEALTGLKILERYGMTETGMNLSNPYAGPRVPGSVGTPLPGVAMRIVTPPEMTDVAPGEEGQLLVRGSNVFSAYWKAPQKTAESFVHDELGQRWFITGDLARQDPATGYVTLLGRSHELIISGGFNIYPREIEEMLESFDGIEEAAVVGVPHPEWGEVPVAYVVCNADLDQAALVSFCRGQLAGFKVPKEFHRVTSLPRNAMGKLQKHLLRE
ncbi:MAG: AMP-binding protein, partial [Caldilineaceae bacterium]|nr:AMP-binding protein [Caldilineaceae bacterium]